jgi:hypothetical protein
MVTDITSRIKSEAWELLLNTESSGSFDDVTVRDDEACDSSSVPADRNMSRNFDAIV